MGITWIILSGLSFLENAEKKKKKNRFNH